jgi:CheY-like chemotaxis protein
MPCLIYYIQYFSRSRGSEFVMQLPEHIKKASAQTGADSTGASARGLRVLVVDDNRDAADSMAAMIGILGNEVRAAYSGFDVQDLVTNFRPELVFLDIGMPGMNGYDVCRELRRTQVGEIRIVALTGYGQESDQAQSREAGFDEHLLKPISLDALQRALGAARIDEQ